MVAPIEYRCRTLQLVLAPLAVLAAALCALWYVLCGFNQAQGRSLGIVDLRGKERIEIVEALKAERISTRSRDDRDETMRSAPQSRGLGVPEYVAGTRAGRRRLSGHVSMLTGGATL